MRFFRRNSSKNKEGIEDKNIDHKNKNNNNNKNNSIQEKRNKNNVKEKPMDKSSSIVLQKCNCGSNIRSESFYDIFLASSVKNSQAYKDLLEQRKRKEAKEEVLSYLADEEIQYTIDKYFNGNANKKPIKYNIKSNQSKNESGFSLITIGSRKQYSVLSAAEDLEEIDSCLTRNI